MRESVLVFEVHPESLNKQLRGFCRAVGRGVTGTLSKLTFGSGTVLRVSSPDGEDGPIKPSFYPLEADGVKACLATGFNHHNQLENNTLFKGTSGTFIARKSDDKSIEGLYSQVALMNNNPGDEENCPESSGSSSSDDILQPDPELNLVSLTVLGLRILFIKTVAFNVLLTLRLCISR